MKGREDAWEHLCIALKSGLQWLQCIDWALYCLLMSWDSQQDLYKQLSK